MAVPAWLQALSQQAADAGTRAVTTNTSGIARTAPTGYRTQIGVTSPTTGNVVHPEDLTRRVSRAGTGLTTPTTRTTSTSGTGTTTPSRTTPTTTAPATQPTSGGMTADEARRVIATTTDPAQSQAAYDALYGNVGPALTYQQRIDQAAGANQSPTVGSLQNFTGSDFQPEWSVGGGYNPDQYATAPTAQRLAEMLGGEYVGAAPYTSGGPFDVGAGQGAGSMIRMPDGRMLNAGLVAKMWDQAVGQYEGGMSNYEQNLAQNPNIIGTGFLSTPNDPLTILQSRLSGSPLPNTNPAGGNAGIQNALAQGQTAYGTPLGQSQNTMYQNAPVGPNNPVNPTFGGTPTGGGTPTPSTATPEPGGGDVPGVPGGTGGGSDLAGGGGPGNPYLPGGGFGGMIGGGGAFGGGLGGGMGGLFGGMGGYGGYGGGGFGGWQPGGFGGGMGGGYSPWGGQSQFGGFNPMNFWGGVQPQYNNPWASMSMPGGGMGSLGNLLSGVQALRSGGYGMQGGWSPFTGFGGTIGAPGGGGGSGMMSFFQQRPPMLPGGSLNQNFYGMM